ncbi:MAG: alpha/beta fold hydrolase [Bacteroidota bacterium]
MRTISLPFDHRTIELEVQWLFPERQNRPLMLFLHEGLGSIALWKDYPRRLCEELECRGLVFSRYGYGHSTQRPPTEKWGADYLHRQAQLLPAFLQALEADKPWIFGHSDGATIALLFAASFPDALQGAIALAPHISVEEKTLRGIGQTREAYEKGNLKQKLARYHADPDSPFWGWHDAWTSPDFAFNIEESLSKIRCPLLLIQGHGDEYASMEQVDGIKKRVPQAEVLKLEDCGHIPFLDRPEAVAQAVKRLMETAEI